MTNSPTLQSRIESAEAELSVARGSHQLSGNKSKVLGTQWDMNEEQLVFRIRHLAQAAQSSRPTKRNVISVLSTIYDPMGILSPFVIRFKMLFQDLCRAN